MMCTLRRPDGVLRSRLSRSDIEGHTVGAQVLDRRDQVLKAATKPVQLPADDSIERPGVGAASIRLSSGRDSLDPLTPRSTYSALIAQPRRAAYWRSSLLKGTHTDMRSVCWSDRIWESNLSSTYLRHFIDCPDFAGTHEGSNRRDVRMTFKLWGLCKQGELKIIDGHEGSE
jgi:hypothetical protein